MIHASGEDYLEAVLVLQKNHGAVRSIDVARRVGVSKASVSYAVSALREGGFLTVDSDYVLHLTETGRNVAEKIYERHQFFTEQFIAAGVDPEIAERDACRIEHAISQDTFEKIRDTLTTRRSTKAALPTSPWKWSSWRTACERWMLKRSSTGRWNRMPRKSRLTVR